MKAFEQSTGLSDHEQLELIQQNLTLCLQQIDQNFAKCHSIITRKILPHVDKYRHVSEAAWMNSKFWKQFFEASANVSISGYCDDEDGDEERSEDILEDEAASVNTTPRGGAQREDSVVSSAQTASPYQRLRTEIQTDLATDDGLDELSSNAPSSNASRSRYTRAQGSMIPMPSSRFDDPDGSPGSLIASPDMPLAKLSLNEIRQDVASPRYMKTTASPIKGGTSQTQGGARSKLLTKVLDKNAIKTQASPSKPNNARTPTAAKKTTWTDLSKVPLNHSFGDAMAFGSPDSPMSDSDLPPGMSPPVTMQFSMPPSKLLKTPARQAANMMVQDLLRTAGAGGTSHLSHSPTGPTPPSLRRHTLLFDAYGTLNEPSQSSSLSLDPPTKAGQIGAQGRDTRLVGKNTINADLDERQKAAIFDRQDDDDDDDDDDDEDEDEDRHRHDVENEIASTNGLDQSIDDLANLVKAPVAVPQAQARKSVAMSKPANRRMTEDTLFGLHHRKSDGGRALKLRGMNKDDFETMHGGRLDPDATGLVDSPLLKKVAI